MKHSTINPFIALCVFVIVALFSTITSKVRAEDAAQHLLSSIAEVTGVPGMSAAVAQDGKITWTGTVGYRNHGKSLPVDVDTKFRIASVSKLFAATLVLQGAENGALDLDTDIRTYVPDWPDHNGALITLRQLASHTSGIDHYGLGDQYDPTRQYDSLSDSIGIFAHKPLLSMPGQAYSYSSYGYALMGAVLEATTKRSFAEILHSNILMPLSLTDTKPEIIDLLPENTSDLFHQNGSPVLRNDQSHVVGATGILSTPSDLVRFASAFSSGHLVDPRVVAMSWEPMFLNNGEPAGTARFGMGFGWRIGFDWAGDQVYHHAGTTPGARSILSLNPAINTAVALVSNAQWVSRIETTAELLATAATVAPSFSENSCKIGEWTFAGVFIEDTTNPPIADNENGKIIFRESNGICTGRLIPTEALSRWLQERGARTAYIPLTLVSVENTDTKVFAAATPWGAFPLHISDDTDSLIVSGSFAGRLVNLTAPITMQSH